MSKFFEELKECWRQDRAETIKILVGGVVMAVVIWGSLSLAFLM